ncbi:MAG: TRAP transporter small permease [Fretibacterium sp.]|nr:TRAP transporter small permease [Fretibacterium sp.]
MKWVNRFFSIAGGLCLTVVFLVTLGQVIQRYVFQLPMPWATDVIRIFFVYSVFLGMGVGVFNKSHLNIDVLVKALPEALRPWFALLSNLVILVFLGTVLFFSFSFMSSNADQVTPYLLFPMSYVYLIIPITVSVMVLFLIMDSFQILRGMFPRESESVSGR